VPNAAFLQSRDHAETGIELCPGRRDGHPRPAPGHLGADRRHANGGQTLSGYHAQAEQAWRNALAGLAACNMQISDIVSIRVYDVAPGDVSAYRELRDRFLQGHAPASTYVIVAGLAHPDLLTEIEVEAFSER
jgi:enamine deaminase RidA (YjgF/YER057c/UK114 family)